MEAKDELIQIFASHIFFQNTEIVLLTFLEEFFLGIRICVLLYQISDIHSGLPKWLSGKESICQCGQRILAIYSPWGRKRVGHD